MQSGRDVLLWALEQHDRWVAPAAPQLRMSYIHGDGNEDNIIVDPASSAVTVGGFCSTHLQAAVTCSRVADVDSGLNFAQGLIDWGDSCKSYVVAEVAIALVCAMSLQLAEEEDPLIAAKALLVSHMSALQYLAVMRGCEHSV